MGNLSVKQDVPRENFMVRATGLEPARPYGRQIFVTLQLSLPPFDKGVRALDYPFILAL